MLNEVNMFRLDKRLVFFLTLMLLGIVMAMQGKTILEISRQQTSVSNRIEGYKDQLLKEQEKNKELNNSIIENQKKKDSSLKELSASKSNDYIKVLGEALDKTSLIAGLTDVKGKGITITLNDAPAREIDNPNLLIIHDSDVYGVLNELKKAGAQAISINGERIISDSEQVCAGPTIRINKNRYPVPYVIMAIGDPEVLFNSLDESKTVVLMRDFNIGVEIKKSNDIEIPPYHNKLESLITGLEVVKK
jgi:uncharacterized protein YlxW (UPF0749 family)